MMNGPINITYTNAKQAKIIHECKKSKVTTQNQGGHVVQQNMQRKTSDTQILQN